MRRHNTTIKIMVIIFLISLQLYAQNTSEATILIIRNPREYISLLNEQEISLKSSLEKEIGKQRNIFIVIARRNDAWVGTSSEDSFERAKLIGNASIIIRDAAQSPVFYDVSPYGIALKKKIMKANHGVVNIREIELTPTVGEANDPFLMIPNQAEMKISGPSKSEETKPTTPRDIFITVLVILVILGLIILIAVGYLKTMKKREEEKKKVHGELLKLRHSSSDQYSIYPTRSVVDDVMNYLNIALFFFLLSIPNDFSLAKSVEVSTSWLSGSEVIYGLVTNNNFESINNTKKEKIIEYQFWIDLSGTAVSMRPIIKKQLTNLVIEDKTVKIFGFGDSVRFIGTVKNLSDIEKMFKSLPKDSYTRLSQALISVNHISDSLRYFKNIFPQIIFFSDFMEDDKTNAGLKLGILPLGRQTIAEKRDTVIVDNNIPIKLTYQELLILSGSFLFILLLVLFFYRKKDKLGKTKLTVNLNGIAMNTRLTDLVKKAIKIGPSIDCDIRTFDSSKYLISAQKSKSKYSLLIQSKDETKDQELAINLSDRRYSDGK